MTRPIPPDNAARERIRTDLATNMLVEAGAGSGKTTSLVGRMVQHIRAGTPVERIAAVTFTRKAANELRERFCNELEIAAATDSDAEYRLRFAQALHDMDRAFIGTIHSFCGRLLREHPLEAGLDPTFQEVSGPDMKHMERSFWRRWISREERAGNPNINAVRNVGIDPIALFDGFVCVRTYPDVHFDAPDCPVPDTSVCRRIIESLLEQASTLRPKARPADGWDPLMLLTQRLERNRTIENWSTAVDFFRSMESISKSSCAITQKRWGDSKETKAAAKSLSESFLGHVDGEIATLVRAWREHRYGLVMRLLQQAAADFQRERHATGQLGFEDLLMLTARLLRQHPATRDELGARYAYLFVDEFQDTDPIQAEVCLLLASPSSEGYDWRTVAPRAGSLFVVGDPKQSIYRFRRADIGVYEFVKRRIAEHGAVLSLVANFRSAHPIGRVVNKHFGSAFGAAATAQQAAFSEMLTTKDDTAARVSYYEFSLNRGSGGKGAVIDQDAKLVASLIAERVAAGRSAGDFLILTRNKAPTSAYAWALAAYNIPATTTGADLPQEHELRELLVVLRVIADPDNSVLVAAALEGLFFGLSLADLWDAKQAGLRLAISHRPTDATSNVGTALLQLCDWWIVSQRQPADVLLERILDDTGLLVHAASEPLGDARAGALLHIVEVLRTASGSGIGGVAAAVERLDELMEESLDDLSLRPGRGDAVRIMNVHQAKGLEAPIVILAAPVDEMDFEPRVHIHRADSGESSGGICIGFKNDNRFTVLAQCPGWDAMQASETAYETAEKARLLYVAATRAECELIVSRYTEIQSKQNKPDSSCWRPLAPAMDTCGSRIEIQERTAESRFAVAEQAASIIEAANEAKRRVEAARKATLTVQTVTESAKRGDDEEPFVLRRAGSGKGPAWGRAVHRTIEAYLRGRRGDTLDAFATAVGADERLPAELQKELRLVAESLATNEQVAALSQAGEALTELKVMRFAPHEGTSVITEGVIDAAVVRDGKWEVVDWKTDAVDDGEWANREKMYARQVEAYGSILTELTGLPASASVQRVL